MKKYSSKEIAILKDTYNKYSHKKEFSKADCVKELIKRKVISGKQTFYAWYHPSYFRNSNNHFNPFALSAITEKRFYWVKEHFQFISPKIRFSVKYSKTSVQLYLTNRVSNQRLKKRKDFKVLVLRILNHHATKDQFTIAFTVWYKGLVKENELANCYQRDFENMFNQDFINNIVKLAKNKSQKHLENVLRIDD